MYVRNIGHAVPKNFSIKIRNLFFNLNIPIKKINTKNTSITVLSPVTKLFNRTKKL